MSTLSRVLTRAAATFAAAALTLAGTATVAPAAEAAPSWKTTTTTKPVDTVIRSADGSVDLVTVTTTKNGWAADIRTKIPGKAEKRTRLTGKGTSWDAYRIVEGADGTVAFVSAPRDYLKAPARLWTRSRGSVKWVNRGAPARTAESSTTPSVGIAKNGTITFAYTTGNKVLTSTLASGGRWSAPKAALTSTELKSLSYGDAFLTLNVAPDGSADVLFHLTGVGTKAGSPVCEIRLATRARAGAAFTGQKRFGTNSHTCGAELVRAGAKTVVSANTGRTRVHVRATPMSTWKTSLSTKNSVTLVGSANGRVTALVSGKKNARAYVLGKGRDASFTKAKFTVPAGAHIAQDAKGRILLAYTTPAKSKAAHRTVSVRFSTPAGTSWGKPKVLATARDTQNVHVASAAAAGNGKYLVVWGTSTDERTKTRVATRG